MKHTKYLPRTDHRTTLPLFIFSRLRVLFASIFFSKLLTRFLFNVDVHKSSAIDCRNWDLTTLVLKKALNTYVKDNQKILEIGTGPLAVLSIYCAKRKNVANTAVDINSQFIDSAKNNAERNGVCIHFLQSDLFSNVHELFDVVFFNPPYVPTTLGVENNRERYTNSTRDLVWDGGPDGCDTIKRFLAGVSSVTHNDSTILLGVNALYVDVAAMKKLIQEADLELVSIVSSPANPSRVYILKRRLH